jgi:uncharacterized repeat protein (TIGR01451 family)
VGLTILKTDNRDITRPGHILTYTITVENTGEETIDDLEITDTLPGQVIAQEIGSGGRIEGNKIVWSNLGLGGGEKLTFTIKVKVKENTSNGHTLVNVVKARSEDKGLSATDTDTTVVEVIGKIAATKDQPKGPQPVPVSARTGATAATAFLSLLTGIGSLLGTIRRFGA